LGQFGELQAMARLNCTSRKWDKLVSDRIKPVLDILYDTITYQQKKEAKRGRSEGEFERYLRRYFSDKIHTGASLKNPKHSRGYEYTADFAYIDPKTNLHIDIEIDEPYSYQSGQPIHCLGTDEDRNLFFNSRLWIVIRFSEKQVVRSPDNCCRQIAEVIDYILASDIPDRLKRFETVQPDPCWTYEEAGEMARENYRDRYLK
jgi:very-short-patch-repair endonuclease